MKKLNIAIVCDPITDYVAGSFVSTLRFAELLKKRGHNIVFIAAKSPNGNNSEYYKDIKIYRFFSILLPKTENQLYMSLPTINKLKKIFKDEKINIVHVIIPTPSAVVSVMAAKKLGLKIVVHSHTQPENIFLHLPKINFISHLNGAFYKYLELIYRRADVIIYPTEFAKKFFIKINEKVRTEVISNGVDTNKFSKSDPEKLFKKFNLPKDKKNILCVGRLHPEKSIDTLIKAMPIILEKFSSAYLYIVGFGHLEGKLKKLASDLKLNNYITFFGKASDEDLILAYNACDIFVLPSLAELEGMVVLEAMSCGKPIVIANAEGSASTYFVDGNGFLFEPENENDLAEKTLNLLQDEKLLKKMGEVSFKKSRQYDIEESTLKLEKVYYSILEE